MKVLLDENLPHQLRAHLRHHDTATAVFMGWSGWKNGRLLDAAENSGFDVLVTGDLSLEHQQNLSERKIAIVSLSTQNWRIIRLRVAIITAAIDGAKAGQLTRVECGVFVRRRRPFGPNPPA